MSTEAPKVQQVAEGVFLFAGLKRSANAYLLRGRRRVVLVDTGMPTATAYLEACLAALGLRPADLDLAVLSHEHVDHAGGAAFLAPHCPIAAHPNAASKLRYGDEFSQMNLAFDERVGPFEVDLQIGEGSVIDLGGLTLEVMHTPGHCSGAICLYEPTRRLLLSGDTLMAQGIIGGILPSGGPSDYLHSLQRLRRLRIERVLPGHGGVSADAEADLERGIERLRGMLDDSHALFSALSGTERSHSDFLRALRDINAV